MKFFKLSATIFIIGLFLTACNFIQPNETTDGNPPAGDFVEGKAGFYEGAYLAQESLDLQAVGALLEQADNAEEFEYLLNSEDGINNLDLNDDGYVDYISVREFDDRYDDERGFSLFSMFGPEELLEIATVIFDRESDDYPGARVLLTGNEMLYGDDCYYEANWLDRSPAIVNWLFDDRDDVYRSPYYVDNYPDFYEVYRVVESPVYRTRIEEFYPEPVFIQTAVPTISQIRIKSPYYNQSAYYNQSVGKIYSQPVEVSRELEAYTYNNPGPTEYAPVIKGRVKNIVNQPDNRPQVNPNIYESARNVPRRINNARPDARGNPYRIGRRAVNLSGRIHIPRQNSPVILGQRQNMPSVRVQRNAPQVRVRRQNSSLIRMQKQNVPAARMQRNIPQVRMQRQNQSPVMLQRQMPAARIQRQNMPAVRMQRNAPPARMQRQNQSPVMLQNQQIRAPRQVNNARQNRGNGSRMLGNGNGRGARGRGKP